MVLLVNEWEVGVKREVHLLLSCYYNIRLILFQTETIRFLFDLTFSGLCLCKLKIIVWTNQDSWRRNLLLWELVMTTFFMICGLWKLFWEQGPLTEELVLITNWIYTFTTICTLMLSTICILKLFKENTPDMWCDGSKSYESFHSFRVKNIKLMLLHKKSSFRTSARGVGIEADGNMNTKHYHQIWSTIWITFEWQWLDFSVLKWSQTHS